MLEVPNAAAKFDCMLFKTLFQSRLDEIMGEIVKLNDASEEVRSSERLRKLMAIILTVGNQINTGGEGNSQAAGFSLDALLKLEEVSTQKMLSHVIPYVEKSHREQTHCSLPQYFLLSFFRPKHSIRELAFSFTWSN